MQHFDIVIIGAGISGIDAACHFKMKCPGKSFIIYEGRDNYGGTWDLFKYPGIRSDSDMHTFSYNFRPWTYHKTISDADTIMDYLGETIKEFGIHEHINYHHWITNAAWSSKNNQWVVKGRDNSMNEDFEVSCNFLMVCAGYYDYDEGYTPDYPGVENYKGRFVHPQKWTDDIVYDDKNVVVIGSGATAVTLIPAMAEKTKHITMLQRSPSYIMSRPLYDKFSKFVNLIFPKRLAHFLARWKNILLQIYLYNASQKSPNAVKKYIQKQIRKVLGKDYPVETHFNPDYNPWDQRLCAVPDNDLFLAIKEGKCSVETEHIETFIENGIRLKSGKELDADLVVSATGLKIKILGGVEVKVDDNVINVGDLMTYKGIMLQDVPNAATVVGYTNASWTLKADLACAYVCRLLNHMDAHGLKTCTPQLVDDDVNTEPVINFSSGYVVRALDVLPKQGDKYPWRLHQNYVKDLIVLKYRKIEDDSLKFN